MDLASQGRDPHLQAGPRPGNSLSILRVGGSSRSSGAWVDPQMGSQEVAGTRGPDNHTLGPFLRNHRQWSVRSKAPESD